jgi:DHA1 family bicyclomycin/chloramphenicol resistance-like MFS transporter
LPKLDLKHPGVVVIVAVGFALNGLSTDMTVASLPGMVRYFGIGVSQAQATLSVFVFAFAFSQVVYGPLSDRFGRRPLLLAGLSIYVLGTLACMLAPTIEALIAARFVQGIGCCAGTVVGRALVRDVHGAEGAARMMGYISACTALLIMSGPIVGGWLEQQFGWRAIFAFHAIVGVGMIAAIALLLGESNLEPDPGATRVGRTLSNYAVLLSNRDFVGHALTVAFSYGCIMAFLSGSSFVLMGLLGVEPWEFGLLLGATITGFIVTSFLTGKLVMRLGIGRLLAIGTPMLAASGTLMAALAVAGVVSIAAIMAPYFLLLLASGLIQPSATAGAIGPFPRIAGTASSLLGVIQLATGALVGFAVGRLYDGTPVPMAAAVALCSLAALASYLALLRRSGAPR